MSRLTTVTPKGRPIVEALLHGPDPSGSAIDYGTGLAYPSKAERARAHPAVGLLFLGSEMAGSSVGIIAAHAAVRDSDLQLNTDRWVQQYRAGWMPDGVLDLPWWEAVWYFVRIYISCTPLCAWWWSDGDLDRSPSEWARTDTSSLLASDPAPVGAPSRAARSEPVQWEPVADDVLARGLPLPVLAGASVAGHPLPVPTLEAVRAPGGFRVRVPSSIPWSLEGSACLSFEGVRASPPGIGAGFVGECVADGDSYHFVVDHVLPPNPRANGYAQDPGSHLFPEERVRERLVRRLRHELDRRGASMPIVRGLADP